MNDVITASAKVPTEAHEHRLLVAYLRVRGLKFTHVANETGTANKWIGVRNKQNGVSPGFPDFLVIVGGRLIAIELKRQKKAWPSSEQLEWLDALNICGIVGRVCKGYDVARNFIEEMEEQHDKNNKQTNPGTRGKNTRLHSEVGGAIF